MTPTGTLKVKLQIYCGAASGSVRSTGRKSLSVSATYSIATTCRMWRSRQSTAVWSLVRRAIRGCSVWHCVVGC